MIRSITWTIAEGNVIAAPPGDARERSLANLADGIRRALAEAYPGAEIEVRRENVSGAFEELEAESDEEDGYVEEDERERIRAIADDVWASDAWEVVT